MPLGVTAWPYHPDPRSSHFSLVGYAFGQVPPDRFRLATTGALPPFDYLNVPYLVLAEPETPPFTTYNSLDGTDKLEKLGFEELDAPDREWSVRWTLTLTAPPDLVYQGILDQVFPNAIQNFAISVVAVTVPGDLIPNPVQIRPLRWNQAA